MNNSRAKFCEECGTPLTKQVEKKSNINQKTETQTKNFAHSLMTENMSEEEKKKYERELRRGARFDEVEMLEVDDEVPNIDKKSLRPQEVPEDVAKKDQTEKSNEAVIEEEKPKRVFGWFRRERKKEEPAEPQKAQPKNIHQEVEIPNLLDQVEVNEEKVVQKFERPEIDPNEETPTLSQFAREGQKNQKQSSDEPRKEQSTTKKMTRESQVDSSLQENLPHKDEVNQLENSAKNDSVVHTQSEETTKVSEDDAELQAVSQEEPEESKEIFEEAPEEKGPKMTTKEVVILNGHSQKPVESKANETPFDLPKTLPVFSRKEQEELEKQKKQAELEKQTAQKSDEEVPQVPAESTDETSAPIKTKDASTSMEKEATEALDGDEASKDVKNEKVEQSETVSNAENQSKENEANEELPVATIGSEKPLEEQTKEQSTVAETEQASLEKIDSNEEIKDEEKIINQNSPLSSNEEIDSAKTELSTTSAESKSNERDSQEQATVEPKVEKETQFVRPAETSSETPQEEEVSQSENGETNTKKTWIWLLIIIIILGALGGGYAYGKKYFSKEEQVNRFISTLDTKQAKQIVGQLEVENKQVSLNQNSIEPFVKLLKQDENYTKNLKKFLLTAKSNEKSDSQDIYLKNSGKKYYLFDDYQFVLRPLDIIVHTNKKDATIWLEGKQVAKSGSEKYSATLGPLLPGKYSLVSKLQEKETTLENVYPKALTRTNGQNLDEINLNLIPLKFTVKSNVKDAEVFVDQKQVGVLKDGNLAVGPISWHEGIKLQLRKTLGSDVVKTESVELSEKQDETYTLDFPEMLTMENMQQVASSLFDEVGKAIKDEKYDYKKKVTPLFVDGEKNNGYKNIAQYIETNRGNKQIESIDFSTKMSQITPKTSKEALGVFEVAIVKHYTSDANKDDEKMVQKYNSLFQGMEKNGKYLVQIKNLGTPETVVDKVEIAKNTPEPTVDHHPEMVEGIKPEAPQPTSQETEGNDDSGQGAGTSETPAAGTQSQGGSSSTGGNSGTTTSGGSAGGSETDWNEGIDYSAGFNTINTNHFLNKMYDVFQSAIKNDGYSFEDAFATYFSGGKANPDYQDFVNYIDLCRRRPDYDYLVLQVKVISTSIGADGNVKVIYDVTYETHYRSGFGKTTRVETFRYNADMVNENGLLKIKTLGKATKVYDNNANT